jgi:RHS repeat-associated protein
MVVESTTPVLGEPAAYVRRHRGPRYAFRVDDATPPPDAAPVDLTLADFGSYLSPESSPVPLEVPDNVDGSLTFPDQSIEVNVVGAASSAAVLTDPSHVAYPDALPDTDVIVAPQDTGAEVSWQARSADSPQDVRLGFALPAGASLQMSSTMPGVAQVVSGSGTLATIPPPQAVDAAGNPVPTSLAVDGDQLVVHTDLSGPSVQFPVLVDPLIEVNDSYRLVPATGTETGSGDNTAGWNYYTNNSSLMTGSTNSSNDELYLANYPATIPNGTWAEYVYQAPVNTFIQRVDFGYLGFSPSNNAPSPPANTRSCELEGIYSATKGTWEQGNYTAYINGNPNVVQYGPDLSPGVGPMGDCGTSSTVPNMPSNTFRAFCVGSYNGPTSWNYDGNFFNGSPWGTTAANTATSPVPSQLADCNAENPARSDQGTDHNEAVLGLEYVNSWARTSAQAWVYGVDVYLASDATPTLDTPNAAALTLPASTRWVNSWQGTFQCDSSVSGSACPASGGPVARDAGFGVYSEALFTPAGNTSNSAPSASSPCTGAPYHSPCPHVWSGPAIPWSTGSWPDGAQTMTLAAFNPEVWGVTPASIAYRVHVDHEAPNTPTGSSFSGPLWDDRATNLDGSTNPGGSSASSPMTGLAYGMQVTGVDPGNASGPAEFDISVDGGTPQVIQDSCTSISQSDPTTQCGALTGGNRTATVTYTFQSADYAPGQHTICVTVRDQVAQALSQPIANCRSGVSVEPSTSQASFTVYTQPAVSLGGSQSANQNDQLGLESFYDYRKLATGAGSFARVNLATGNLVWDDVPVVDVGQGLSTFVEVVYNSQHRLSELATLQGQPLQPTAEYNQIGQGFSLGIDGLTRLNEPLDLSVAPAGRISFTDVDGTRHTFVQDPSNAQHWIAPPGVFLWLRQWSASDASKAWAITRPDGVTFFFDQAGYETQIEDRQANTITLQRQTLVANLQTGLTTSCPVALPSLGPGCSERVTDVIDQNGQDMRVCYYDTTSETGCPGAAVGSGDSRLLKVEDVVDHAAHDLHFDYDSSGDLTAMTVSAESTDPNAKRVFSFGYGGANDAQPGIGGLPALADLSPGSFPAGLTQIIDPDGHATALKYAAAQALDSTDPCPRDLSNPAPPQEGGLIGLEPKCVVQLTDRGNGQTSFVYTTATDSSGSEIHTANVQGPRSDPPGSGTRPDHWIDTTDVYGRPTQEQDPLSRIALLTWNNTGASQPGNTLAKLVQASGSLDQVTTLYSYDQNGRLSDRQGPANTATGSTEKQNFREVKITYQLSPGTLTAPSGADTAHCSSSDRTLCFVSDPTSLSNPDGQLTTFTPDPSSPNDGLVTKITDPAGQSWSTSYDQYGRITVQTEPGTGGGPETTTYGNFDPYTGLPQTKTLPTDSANGSQTTIWHYAYDKLGNLLAVTDPRNSSLAANAAAPTTAGSAYTTVFKYDALSRTTAEYDSKDSASSPGAYTTKTFSYDPNDDLKARIDANGKQFTYAFTPMDWLASQTTPAITQADGSTKPAEVTSYCYDEQGAMTDRIDPLGQPANCTPGSPAAQNHEIHMVYDGDGELLVSERTASAGGATNQLTSYAYDNRGDQVGTADPTANNGATIAQAESNAQSATSGTVGPTWRTRTYYDADGNPIETVQNPNASDGTVYASRLQYDAAGLLLASEDARGPSVSKDASTGEFDLSASPVVADTTVYAYDSRGLLDQITDPAGDLTQIERAADGKTCGITAPNGPAGVAESDCSAGAGNDKTSFTYYAQGWLKQIGLPTAAGEYSYGTELMTVAYTRDHAGYPTTITDPRGNAFGNTFYDNGELKSTTRPSWWTYDPHGGAAGPDPNGGGQGQVSSETPGGGLPIREKTLQEIYKSDAAQANQTFPSDNQAGKFGHVAAQSLPGILPPAGQTTFAYDGNGNLTSVQDALAAGPVSTDTLGTTRLIYDELGEPIEIDQPFDATNLTKTFYAYDADGNLASADTPALTGAGQTASDTTYRTTNSYDGLDRLIETDQPGSKASANDSSITTRKTTYCYALAPANGATPCTPTGQPTQPVASIPGTGSGQTFTVGERVQVTRPSSTSNTAVDNATYEDYDALGNLIQTISPPPNTSASAAQTPHTTYTYDAIGDQMQILRPLGQPAQNGGTANLAYATQLSYDAAGRLKSSTRNKTETTSYSYDHDSNVSQVSAPGATAVQGGSTVPQILTSYVYNGRDLPWQTTTGAGSPADGQTNARTTVTEYDGDGNLIRTVKPSSVGTNGLPFNPYDGSYTSSGTGTDSTGAANLDATIRVYTPTNALSDVYLPWGCSLRANTDKTACTTSTTADTRRFKEHLTVDQTNLNQVTGITEAYDWTNPSAKQYATTYNYYPSNWIKTETDPTTDTSATKSSTYTYDPAGHQTGWLTAGNTAGTANSTWGVSRGYWPSGEVGAVCRGASTGTCSTDPTITPNPTFKYFYLPSGRQATLAGTLNGGSSTDTQANTYFPDGSLSKVNESGESCTGCSTYDTVYSYDLDGNVLTRQQGGQILANTYTGGTKGTFTYNGDDRETSMNVDGTDATQGSQPHRTFTTSYWPSGQPQTSTRIQCSKSPCRGTPVTENYFYADDGALSQDTRSSDSKNQTYAYDTDGNRTQDETGTHLYNALDQETQWTRGSTQDQANSGTTVSYLLDGTGGLLRQIDTAGALATDGTKVPVTSWYCSAGTIGAVSGTTSSSSTYGTGCQHDADRVEVVNSVSWNTSKVQISNPTVNYCYNSLAQMARVTIASCPADDAAIQSLNLQTGETAPTTAVYQHDSFGDQTTVKAPDPNSSASNPSIDTVSYSYDGLDRRYQKTDQIASSWTSTATPVSSVYGYVGQSNQIAIEKDPDPSAPLTLVPHIYDYNSTGQKLGFWQGTSTANPSGIYHTYSLDAKGSIEALENTNNTITNTNRYHYTPYGNLEKGVAQGGGNTSSTTTVEQSLGTDAETNNYRFEGFYDDSGIATYDLQARNYRPEEGIYTTQDSFEQALGNQALRADPLTQNLYAFAGGNPTTNIEWDGHCYNPATGGEFGSSPVSTPFASCNATTSTGTPTTRNPQPGPEGCSSCGSLPPGGHPLTPVDHGPSNYSAVAEQRIATTIAAAALSAQQAGGNFHTFLTGYLNNPEDVTTALSAAAQTEQANAANRPFELQGHPGDFFDAFGGASCGLNGICLLGNAGTAAYQQADSAAQSAAPVVNGAMLITGLGAAIKDLGAVGVRALLARLGSEAGAADAGALVGRDALGRFTGAGGYGAEGEAQGLADYELATGQSVIRNQVRASLSGGGPGRFYDGLVRNADGTYTGIEVKSGSASLTAPQRAFDSAVNGGEVARATLNGRPIEITSTELVRVP